MIRIYLMGVWNQKLIAVGNLYVNISVSDQQLASKSQHNITWKPEVIADLIGARKEARRRKRVWEEWAIREFGGVGIAYNNPNVTFSKVDDMFKGKIRILLLEIGLL